MAIRTIADPACSHFLINSFPGTWQTKIPITTCDHAAHELSVDLWYPRSSFKKKKRSVTVNSLYTNNWYKVKTCYEISNGTNRNLKMRGIIRHIQEHCIYCSRKILWISVRIVMPRVFEQITTMYILWVINKKESLFSYHAVPCWDSSYSNKFFLTAKSWEPNTAFITKIPCI